MVGSLQRSFKHKYGAKPTKRGEIKFPSRLEGNCYDLLLALKNSEKILFFLRQIPVDLIGGHKYICDFLAFTKDEAYFIEAKGKDLPMGRLKRNQAEEMLGVQIHVVNEPQQILGILIPKTPD